MVFKPIREEIREIRESMERVCDYACEGERLLNCHSCNDCDDIKECAYSPKWGEPVRINCPFWKNAESLNTKAETTETFKMTEINEIKVAYIIMRVVATTKTIVCVCADRFVAEQKVKEYEEADQFGHYVIESWEVR